MKPTKPTVGDILDLYKDAETRYAESGLFSQFDEDEKYYECDFAELLKIPNEFKSEVTVLPTPRDMVDTCVDYTDIFNPIIKVPLRNETKEAKATAEIHRKFAYGVLWRNNMEASIAPLRVSAKHYYLHGLAIQKTVWDADRWVDRPERKEDEVENDYANRMDEWRSTTHDSIPIVMQGINPQCIMLDPSYDGGGFVFETREELVFNVQQKLGNGWKNYNNKKITERIKHISYWDKNYRCELYDNEPVLKVAGGVYKHPYGFIPYVAIDTGLGNISVTNDLSKRYVGILRYMLSLLRSESRDYSLADILLAREVLTGGFLQGANAKLVTDMSAGYGEWPILPDGVTAIPYEPKLPPQELMQHLSLSSDYISAHSAPRSTRGLSEQGVRSGSDRQIIQSQAAQRYQYSNHAFRHGVSKVLSNCARIMKNVVPGSIHVWAKTPNDEIDLDIEKDDLKEPFTFYVTFSSESDDEKYRLHDDLERQLQSGLTDKDYVRRQMPNVDVEAMAIREQKQMILQSDPFQQVLVQTAAGKLAQAIQSIEMANNPVPPPAPQMQPPTGGMPQQGAPQPMPGNMTIGTPNIAVPGSAQDMQNKMAQQRSQTPMSSTQGRGINAGGNKHA
jgi:hypothetical protein